MKQIITALMLMICMEGYGQCSFQTNQQHGCQGFNLNLADTTTGAVHTSWAITLPDSSVLYTYNSQLSSTAMTMPGVVRVTMTDTINGQACTVSSNNFHVYGNPVIRGRISTDTALANQCIYWLDSSSAGLGCTLDSFQMDWGNSQPFQMSQSSQCETYNFPGTYHPTLIMINSCGCRVDSTFTDSITIVSVYAGPNQTICQNSIARMAALDTGTWSALASNPTAVTIDSASPTTVMSGFTLSGIYSFVWTTGAGTDTMTVTVNVKPNAGPPQTTSTGGSVIMAAQGSGTWTAGIGNPGTASITTPSIPSTTITGFTSVGTYHFVWTNGIGCSDTTDIVVVPPPCGFTASQYYGCPGFTLNLTDTTTGAGQTAIWTITLADNTVLHTYNSSLSANIINAPGWVNVSMTDTINGQACIVSSSNFFAYAKPLLRGSFSADTALVGQCIYWFDSSLRGDTTCGPLSYQINWGNSAPFDTVPGLCARYPLVGTYSPNIKLINSCGCIVDSTFTNAITIVTVYAGPGQTICQNSIARMAALGTGTWAALASNPTAVTIDSLSSPTTVMSGFTQSGVYSFAWTTGAGTDTMTVTVTVNPNPTPTFISDTICIYNSLAPSTPGASYLWSTGDTSSYLYIDTAGTYSVTVTGAGGCLAVTNWHTSLYPLMVLTATVDTPCGGMNNGSVCMQVSGGVPPYGYQWLSINISSHSIDTLSQGLNTPPCLTNLSSGYYILEMSDASGCANPTVGDSFPALHTCPVDYVWPGDADANHIVNNADLLPIGLGYDSIGPVRAVQGIVWQGDIATNWADTLPGYNPTINFKHADCNGDGIINAADTVAIMANFSLTHAKTSPILGQWRSGIPAIKAIVTPDTAYNGDTLTITFELGDTNTTVNNFYGLAFTYNFDPRIMDSTYTPTMGFFPTSWIGSPGQKISINKIDNNSGQILAAVTRINHTPASGSGAIAKASFRITTDNISGKDYHYYTNIGSITDVTLIDQYGNPLPLNAGADTTTVGFYPNGIREVTTETLRIQPNPARDRVLVSAGNTIREISLSNIIGQQVLDNNTVNSKSVNIDISGLDSGVYIVQVRTEQGTGIAKLVVER